MAQLLKVLRLDADGTSIPIKPGGSFRKGGFMRESVVSGDAIDFTEQLEPAELQVKVLHRSNHETDVAPKLEGTNIVLTVECDNGVAYKVSNAFRTETPTINADDGDVDYTFHGRPAEAI